MRSRAVLAGIVLMAASAAPALGADPRYPDCPCPQAKVP